MNSKLATKINKWKEEDQKIRRKWKDGSDSRAILKKVKEIDNSNYRNVLNLIKAYGYPTSKLIGKRGMKSFWLLIQHVTNDLELQKNCLKYCDFEAKEKAYLIDRIHVYSKKKQIYGTQFQNKNGEFTLYPIKDIKKMKVLRKQVGLQSIEEYLKLAKVKKPSYLK